MRDLLHSYANGCFMEEVLKNSCTSSASHTWKNSTANWRQQKQQSFRYSPQSTSQMNSRTFSSQCNLLRMCLQILMRAMIFPFEFVLQPATETHDPLVTGRITHPSNTKLCGVWCDLFRCVSPMKSQSCPVFHTLWGYIRRASRSPVHSISLQKSLQLEIFGSLPNW